MSPWTDSGKVVLIVNSASFWLWPKSLACLHVLLCRLDEGRTGNDKYIHQSLPCHNWACYATQKLAVASRSSTSLPVVGSGSWGCPLCLGSACIFIRCGIPLTRSTRYPIRSQSEYVRLCGISETNTTLSILPWLSSHQIHCDWPPVYKHIDTPLGNIDGSSSHLDSNGVSRTSDTCVWAVGSALHTAFFCCCHLCIYIQSTSRSNGVTPDGTFALKWCDCRHDAVLRSNPFTDWHLKPIEASNCAKKLWSLRGSNSRPWRC